MMLATSLKLGHKSTLMFHYVGFVILVMHPFLGDVIGFDFLQEHDIYLNFPLLETLGIIFPKKTPYMN
jgi:hypothetical protein